MRLSLQCHADTSTQSVAAVTVDVKLLQNGQLHLIYRVAGMIADIALLDETAPERTDYLWQKTCFEAFVGRANESAYLEFNLSPSTEWAVYGFESHRKGMHNVSLATDPLISRYHDDAEFRLDATLDLAGTSLMAADAAAELALTAVIEEQNGTKSLWALAHPPGDPDFHNRDCFTHKLKAEP